MSEPDPAAARTLFRHARREALLVACVWAAALLWTVGCCYVMGYAHTADDWPVRLGLVEAGARRPALVLGFPDWIFWGVLVPWVACSCFTVVFGLRLMADDDLGDDTHEAREGVGHGH